MLATGHPSEFTQPPQYTAFVRSCKTGTVLEPVLALVKIGRIATGQLVGSCSPGLFAHSAALWRALTALSGLPLRFYRGSLASHTGETRGLLAISDYFRNSCPISWIGAMPLSIHMVQWGHGNTKQQRQNDENKNS